jgi:hypothetical protein
MSASYAARMSGDFKERPRRTQRQDARVKVFTAGPGRQDYGLN